MNVTDIARLDAMGLASSICTEQHSPSQFVNAVLEPMKGIETGIRALGVPTPATPPEASQNVSDLAEVTKASHRGAQRQGVHPKSKDAALWAGRGISYIAALIGVLLQHGLRHRA